MENDPITMADISRAFFQIIISTAIGLALLYGFIRIWHILQSKIEMRRKKIKRKRNYKTMLNTLNFSVINDDIKDIVQSIEL